MKSFKLKFPKAEELKRNAATSKYGRQILQAMRPVFADLVAEIQRSIGFYASIHKDSHISRVVALGGTFRLPGLQKYLQQNLQLEVARIDRLGNSGGLDAKVAAAFSDNMLSCVSAYGLALQAMGDAAINSSLLPQKIRRERMWRNKTKWFATAAALVLAGTGVAYGSYYYLHLQDDKDHLNYGEKITRTLAQASALDNEWKTVSDSGGPDRADSAHQRSAGGTGCVEQSAARGLQQTASGAGDRPGGRGDEGHSARPAERRLLPRISHTVTSRT